MELRKESASFLEEQEEQEVLALFHKTLEKKENQIFLVDTISKQERKIQDLSQQNLPTEIKIETEDLLFFLNKDPIEKKFHLTRIFFSKKDGIYESSLHIQKKHFFSMQFLGETDISQEPIFYIFDLSKKQINFSITNSEELHNYFFAIYTKEEDAWGTKSAAMRFILKKAWQKAPTIMQYLEEKEPILQTAREQLLPHLFEEKQEKPIKFQVLSGGLDPTSSKLKESGKNSHKKG